MVSVQRIVVHCIIDPPDDTCWQALLSVSCKCDIGHIVPALHCSPAAHDPIYPLIRDSAGCCLSKPMIQTVSVSTQLKVNFIKTSLAISACLPMQPSQSYSSNRGIITNPFAFPFTDQTILCIHRILFDLNGIVYSLSQQPLSLFDHQSRLQKWNPGFI